MESDQIIAKIICFFNCKDGEDSTPVPTVTSFTSSGITTSTEGNYAGSGDSVTTAAGGSESPWDILPEEKGKKKTSETDDYWYVFLILVWPYIVSMSLNTCCSLLIFYRHRMKREVEGENKKRKPPDEDKHSGINWYNQKLENYLGYLGLDPGAKDQFLWVLLGVCSFCVLLNLVDLVYLIFYHFFSNILYLPGVIVSIALQLLFSVSLLFYVFIPDNHIFLLFLPVTFSCLLGIVLFLNSITFSLNWISAVLAAVAIAGFFTQFIVFLLKPEWISLKMEPLNDPAVKFLTFYTISAMGALSVVIPTRLLWRQEFSLIFFVTESLGRLMFTIPHAIYFIYTIMAHSIVKQKLFHRRSSLKKVNSIEKKKDIFAETKY